MTAASRSGSSRTSASSSGWESRAYAAPLIRLTVVSCPATSSPSSDLLDPWAERLDATHSERCRYQLAQPGVVGWVGVEQVGEHGGAQVGWHDVQVRLRPARSTGDEGERLVEWRPIGAAMAHRDVLESDGHAAEEDEPFWW